MAGMILFALNVAFDMAALTRLNLSVTYPMMVAGGVIVVVSASVFFLRKALAPPQVVGLLLLIPGVVLVTNRLVT